MNPLRKICLLSAILAFPASGYAQTDTAPKSSNGMNCPMTADMGAMQKNMGGMMADMSAMTTGMRDPSMKARMEKMHDQMTAMMVNMQKMGGSAMPRGQTPGSAALATPPASPEEHDAHHPAQ